MKLNEYIKEKVDDAVNNEEPIILKRGVKTILKAEDEDYDRGITVELKEDGGYDLYYWYNDPMSPTPVEVKVDGESIKPDAKDIHIGFHPELQKEKINESGSKKLLNEALPPTIYFDEMEVSEILWKIFDGNIPEHATEIIRNKLKEKGRCFDGESNIPPGAYS